MKRTRRLADEKAHLTLADTATEHLEDSAAVDKASHMGAPYLGSFMWRSCFWFVLRYLPGTLSLTAVSWLSGNFEWTPEDVGNVFFVCLCDEKHWFILHRQKSDPSM